MMRKVKSHWAARDAYLSSPAPDSVARAYHKIWEAVKETKVAAASLMFHLVRGPCCAIIRRLTKNKTFSLPRALVLNHQRQGVSVDIADVAVDIDMFESPVSSRKRPGRCYYFTRSTP
jgi:hypothetical protein